MLNRKAQMRINVYLRPDEAELVHAALRPGNWRLVDFVRRATIEAANAVAAGHEPLRIVQADSTPSQSRGGSS
jgi:uncharacterized protein (DUF1778 family)